MFRTSKAKVNLGDHAGQRTLKAQSGQIVVEYILLMVIVVAIAIIISTTMVSRNTESPGFLIVKWRAIIDAIAQDPADDLNPPE